MIPITRMIKLHVVEDSISKYLQYLQDNISQKKEDIVKEGGISLASMVYTSGHKHFEWNDESGKVEFLFGGNDNAPDASGALLSSGLNPNQHRYTSSKDYSVMEIYWTGMYADYSWWEFREDGDTSKPPERDYAYYQETGSDSIAKYSHAHHKGYFTRTVNDKGTQEMVEQHIANEYMRVLFNR